MHKLHEKHQNDINNIALVSLLLPADKYMFKVNNRDTIARCKICSKLTIDTPGRRHWRCLEVFIGNFEH